MTMILIAFPCSLRAEEIIHKGEKLSLARCIEIALKKSPSITSASNAVEVTKSKVGQSQSAYYPQIDANAGYTRYSDPSVNGGDGTSQYSAGVSLKQNIYDFGRTSSQVSIQKHTLGASGSDLSYTVSQVIFNTKQAYFTVLKAKRNRDVAEETVKQFAQHLGQATGFFKVGLRPKFDVTKAEVDHTNAKLLLIRAENSLKLSMAGLNNVMGITNAPDYDIDDILTFEKYATTFEQAIEKAYANRSDLKAIREKKKALEESIKFAKSGYLPTLSGNASYKKTGEDTSLNSEYWTVGVTLTVPLFSGFSTKYQVDENVSTLLSLTADEELLKQTIYLEVQQAYLDLIEAEERIPTSELNVKQASENLDIATGRYNAGVGNPIEVTDAEVSYNNAKLIYNQALYDYKVAQARLEKAMGIQ